MKLAFAVPRSGCAWWRCIQPAQMIKKLGLAEVQVFDQNTMGEVEIQDMLQWSDVIIQQSPLGIETVASIAKFKDMGKAVVGDYDDLTFSLSPFNPA